MPLRNLTWLRPNHIRLPRPLSAIPLPALQLIALLILVNAVVWAAAGILLRNLPKPNLFNNHISC